jgi:hypothetical protein
MHIKIDKMLIVTGKNFAGKLLTPPGTWISLNKVGQPSYARWANGEPLTYTDWGPGSPNQLSTEHCASLE